MSQAFRTGKTTPHFLAAGGDMGALMRAKRWEETPLGPIASWPQSLKTSVSTCLNCAFPILIWWGPELVMLYNDEYRVVIGEEKHPAALGAPGREIFPELWDVIGPMLEHVRSTGEATRSRDLLLVMNRHGYAEETYFSFSYSPIADESGGVGGIFAPVMETTDSIIGARRLQTLRDLAGKARSQTADEALTRAADTLAENPHDVPFALVYRLPERAGDGGASLVGAAGAQAGDPIAPVDGSAWPLEAAAERRGLVVIDDLGRRFAEIPAGAWTEAAHTAVVLPISLPGRDRPSAALVCGINPHKRLDAEHRGFFELIASQIEQTLAEAEAYQEERRRAEALAEVDQAKTAFFSNVSHEFRTPLTLIHTPVEELLRGRESLPAGVQEKLETVGRNSERLLRLVNSLLDFSRIEAGRARARYEPVDLGALTAELASNFRAATDKAGLELTVDCATLSAPVYVDPEMWEKVVLNLVSNAFKFTLKGAITVAVRETAGGAELSVADTGSGIPAQEIPRLFERFHRIEGSPGRSFEGSGIGLALVQELVRLHGGRIEVESTLGQGSRFRVILPFGAAHLPPEAVASVRARPGGAGHVQGYVQEALNWLPRATGELVVNEFPRGALTDDGEGRTVVLADDNADMRTYLARLLTETGYNVAAYADGEAALEAIRRKRPDLVLSDVMMPRLDGFGLVAAIRAEPELSDLPIVLLSARAGEEARIHGLQAGADDYLVKPFSARELTARVKAAVRLAEARREAAAARRTETVRILRLFDKAPGFICVLAGPDHCFEFANESYRRLVGRQELLGLPVREVFPEIADQGFFELLDRVYASGEPYVGLEAPVELEVAGKPVRRFLDFIYQPVRDDAGQVTGIFVEGFDVTDRALAAERQQVLVNELNHRVKNSLATVQAITAQSLRDASNLTQARLLVEERLASLARAHDMLTREQWAGADLQDTISRALEPFRADASDRIGVSGCDMRLPPGQVLALSMALHELATNAAKYGALSSPQGEVRITCTRLPNEATLLAWCETGGPTVTPPSRSGFGSRLLQRGLAHELGGAVRISYEPSGVVCEIEVPPPPTVEATSAERLVEAEGR